MIRLSLALLALLFVAQSTFACESNEKFSTLSKLLDGLASKKGMEFVYGDRFPSINPYGSYGSSYVLDFVDREGIENSIFFLARKKNKFYKESGVKDTTDLVRKYDYFYIYAVKDVDAKHFQVKDIISEGAGLMGMSLFYGWIDIKAREFIYIDSGLKVDTSSIDRRKLSTAILISAESSTKFLFNYDGRWIQSSEIEL